MGLAVFGLPDLMGFSAHSLCYRMLQGDRDTQERNSLNRCYSLGVVTDMQKNRGLAMLPSPPVWLW
jgi:hypothetical protein